MDSSCSKWRMAQGRDQFLTRKEKILALLPPDNGGSDEEISSSDDEHQEFPENVVQDTMSVSDISSEAPSLSESVAELIEIINDLPDRDDDIALDVVEEEPILLFPQTADNSKDMCTEADSIKDPSGDDLFPNVHTITTPIKNQPSEVPNYKTVFTPMKTRSACSKQKQNSSTVLSTDKTILGGKIISHTQKKQKKNRRLPNSNNYTLEHDWSNNEFEFPVQIPSNTFTTPEQICSPLEYFKKFFTDDMVQVIVENTNIYSVQETGKSINVIGSEIWDFIAIHIFMGVVNMPSYIDYWSQKFRYEEVAEIMPLKRYQQLRRFIHFVNNNKQDDDKYFKVRPLLDMVRKNCLNIENEKRQSIDEMMVPYKGKKAGSRKQYIKSKPKKWGYKIFVRAGISGFVYDFIVYGGEDTFRQHNFTEEENSLGLGAKVVIALSQSMKDPACSVLYFDNFFTSLKLLHLLRWNYGILSLGTIRSNRLRNCDLENDKLLARKGRGSFCEKSDNKNKISCTKWIDNKPVILVSTYVSAKPVSTTKRYDKVQKKKIDVSCPNIVKHYNAHMGGVDLMDMLISLYRITLKTRRWYLSLFAQMLDISLNNAWLLYRRECSLLKLPEKEIIALKCFRYEVAKTLKLVNRPKKKRQSLGTPEMSAKKIKCPVLPRPPEDVRKDKVDHFPIYGTKGRCRNCKKGETHWYCQKCNTRLCLVKERNCFYDFHNTE